MSDHQERLEALEVLAASEGWGLLVKASREQQQALNRELLRDELDLAGYRTKAAEYRQIEAILTFPQREAAELRRVIEANPQEGA